MRLGWSFVRVLEEGYSWRLFEAMDVRVLQNDERIEDHFRVMSVSKHLNDGR